jgi:serine/threonine protein kinase
MPAVAPPPPFLENLARSGLFSAQQQEDLVCLLRAAGLHPADHAGVAKWCVQEGYLTKFQAQQLLKGKWRNHVINRKYKVLEPLGQGGMGAVFRCEHLALGKEVALKILPTEMTSDTSALQRFLREARALAALDHPNIVGAHDVDEVNGQYFIVMACVEGITLLDLVRRDGPMPAATAAACMVQTCRGLQHAHEAGWVHRDLKPGNLILDQDSTVKIMDFGLARLATPDDGGITRQHNAPTLLGSPDYISPEQAMNSPDIDIRADIYSLGATLYFLLTGHAPFEGEPLMQKLLAHQMREPEEVSFFRNDIPAGLVLVLKQMMAKKPADRFATPREVAQALEPFLREPAPGAKTGKKDRSRSGKMRRVPTFDQSSQNTPMADLLGTVPDVAASMSPSPSVAAPAPSPSGESEPEPELLSPKTKRILAWSAAAAGVVAGIILLILWLTATPSRESRLAQAEQLGRQKRWEPAAALLADLLRETPEGSKDRKELYSRITDWPAVALLLLQQFPNDRELNQIAARQHAQQGEYSKAIACLEKHGLADSDSPELWYQLASYAARIRDWAKAAKALEKACRGKPDQVEWYRNRAFACVALGDNEQYQRVCGEMLTKFGDRGQPRQIRLEVGYACSMGAHDRPQLEAVLQLGEGLFDEDRRGPKGHFSHCAALYRAGKWAEALRLLDEGDTFKTYWPHQAFCQPLIAMCQYRLGRREEARQTLAKHRQWLREFRDRTASTRTESRAELGLTIAWDALAMENLTREARDLMEDKNGSR